MHRAFGVPEKVGNLHIVKLVALLPWNSHSIDLEVTHRADELVHVLDLIFKAAYPLVATCTSQILAWLLEVGAFNLGR